MGTQRSHPSSQKVLAVLCLSVLAAIYPRPSWAQDNSAVDVQNSCAHWSKLRLDKHKQFKGDSTDLYDTGVCLGYFEGLMDGMDDTGGWQLNDGTLGAFQIKRSSINST